MNKRLVLWAVSTAVSLFTATSSFAYFQTPNPTFCGDLNQGTVGTKMTWDFRQHFIKLNRAGNIYMPNFGTGSNQGDTMSQPYWSDSDLNNGAPWNAAGWNETWYVPADADPTTRREWRRLFSNTYQDHMDSEDQYEGSSFGYAYEGPVGYPFTTQREGTQPLARYFTANWWDHRTERPGLTLSATNSSGGTLNYSQEFRWNDSERVGMFAYPRYGTLYNTGSSSGRCTALSVGYVYQLKNDRVTVDFNREWGNAIGKITVGGRQLVVGGNIGAMVQTVLWRGVGTDSRYYMNPTEAGGWDDGSENITLRWAGSPILSVTTPQTFNSSSPAPVSMTTRLKPLNYYHRVWTADGTGNDTSGTQPLMWRGTFERKTTVGYAAATGYLDNVIKIGFSAELDSDVTSTAASQYWAGGAVNMMPTYWLHLHNFGTDNVNNTVPLDAYDKLQLATYKIDSANATLQPVTKPTVGGASVRVAAYAESEHNAVIAYSSAKDFAIGFLSHTGINGQMHGYDVFVTSDVAAEQALGVNMINFHSLYDATAVDKYPTETEDSYMVVGTLNEVKTSLRRIYCTEKNTTCN